MVRIGSMRNKCGYLRWDAEEQAAYVRVAVLRIEQRSMGESATHGGELVPLTLDPHILLTSEDSINPLRTIARTVVTTRHRPVAGCHVGRCGERVRQ